MRDRFRTKRSRILLGIVSVFFLLVIIGSLTGDTTSEPSQETSSARNTPTATPQSAATLEPIATATPEPIVAMSVGELHAKRDENATRYDQIYKDKKVLVNGVVCKIESEDVFLGDSDSGCAFLVDDARLQDIPVEQLMVPSAGDPFTAICTVGEYILGTIFMKDCFVPDEATLSAYATVTPAPTPVPAETPIPPTPRATSSIQAPTATATPETDSSDESQPIRTPTAEEVMEGYIFCERLVVGGPIYWGQSPQVVFSMDPRVTGQLEEGDYVQILTPNPTEDGLIRVQVYPHDYRQVGQTNDQVWISWDEVLWAEQNGLSDLALKCED